jgi:hypothetical protein
VTLVGIPCPVPNCRGYVKVVDGQLRCEFGHIVVELPDAPPATGDS